MCTKTYKRDLWIRPDNMYRHLQKRPVKETCICKRDLYSRHHSAAHAAVSTGTPPLVYKESYKRDVFCTCICLLYWIYTGHLIQRLIHCRRVMFSYIGLFCRSLYTYFLYMYMSILLNIYIFIHRSLLKVSLCTFSVLWNIYRSFDTETYIL